jgi:hypothetical protein
MNTISPPRLRAPRRGFTFVELVVILVIAFIIVGLALTFMLRMREKSNLAACENNLRQIGQAVFLYRDQAKPHALPPSRIADGYATWAVLIAPNLDERKVGALRRWNRKPTQFYAQQPDEIRQAQVSIYYCPARRGPGYDSVSGDVPPDDVGPRRHFPGALSDYASAAGDGDPAHLWTSAKANGALILGEVLERGPEHAITDWRGRTDFRLGNDNGRTTVFIREGTGPAESVQKVLKNQDVLKRGTSQTILIGEKHVRLGDFGRADVGDGSVYNGGRPASFSRIGGKGHGIAPAPTAPLKLDAPVFGSYHPGGVCKFLMADLHVESILPSIDEALLGRLVVRDGD